MRRVVHLTFDEFVPVSRALKVAGIDGEPILAFGDTHLAVDPDFDRAYRVTQSGGFEEITMEKAGKLAWAEQPVAMLRAAHDPSAATYQWELDEDVIERYVPDWRRVAAEA